VPRSPQLGYGTFLKAKSVVHCPPFKEIPMSDSLLKKVLVEVGQQIKKHPHQAYAIGKLIAHFLKKK
jgi:hypothetical protein